MAIKHPAPSGGIVNADDYQAAHILDGTPGMLLGANGAEINPASLSTSAVGAGLSLLFSAAAGSTVAAAITSLHTAGYSVAGWGAARYVYDAAVSAAFVTAHPRASFLAADGRGFRLDLDQYLTAGMFGIIGDGVTDITPAFNGMQTYLRAKAPSQQSGLFKSSQRVFFPLPPKHYYTATGLNLNLTMDLVGAGSGAPNTNGCIIRSGVNCSVLTVNEHRTLGNGLGSVGDASGSLVQGFCLFGGNVGADASGNINAYGTGLSSSGHGLNVRGTGVRISDISSYFNAQDGIYIHADSGFGDSENGNANNWRSEDTWCLYNDGSGFHVYGLDANAGTAVNANCIQNRVAGIFDQTFLGNTWVQPHVRDCGIISSTGLNLPTGMCSYPTATTCYTVAVGKTVQASTTVPGTNSTVWILVGGSHPSAKPWVTGMTWEVGAPYLSTNINARIMFLNPYAESAQGKCQIAGSTVMMHGIMDIGDDAVVGIEGSGTGIHVKVGSGALTAPAFNARTTNSYIGGDAYFGVTGAGFTHKINPANANGRVTWTSGNGGSGGAAFAVGTPSDSYGVAFGAARLYVAPYNSGTANDMGYGLNFLTTTSEVVSVGKFVAAGSRFFNASSTTGAPEGWVCTASGVPASTAVLKPTGIIGGVQATAQADSVAADAATLKTDFNALLAKLRTANLIAT